MNPSIINCVKSGFRTANQSFPAIAISLAAWVVAAVLSLVLLFAAATPFRAVQKLAQTRANNQKPPVASQLNPPPSPVEPQTTPRPVSPEEKTVREWIAKSGTIFSLVLLGILWLSVITWLRGGQIGYLSRKIRNHQATVSDFFSSGVKSFFPLLGARVVSISLALTPILLFILFVFLVSRTLPKVIAGLFVFLGFFAVIYAVIWVGLKLVFYLISIVADQRGPLESLKFNFSLTRARMLHILGLLLVFSLLNFGLSFANGFFNLLAKLVDSGALMFKFLGIVVWVVAGAYLDYFNTAASITYYDTAKNSTL